MSDYRAVRIAATPADRRCDTCHAPVTQSLQKTCNDCVALAASPHRPRGRGTHAFIAGSGGWCWRCGVKREDAVHMPGITGQVPSTTEGVW